MDNLFQNGKEHSTEGNSSASIGHDDDIKFEENIDIEDIQRQLIAHMEASENIETEESQDTNKDLMALNEKQASEEKKNAFEQKILNSLSPLVEIDAEAKKYVIYIDSDNIDFVESLSVPERRKAINKALKNQNEQGTKNRKIAETRRFLQHALVSTFTFIIGFPIMFFCVNKSIEMTVLNYTQAKNNFSQLYKAKGKVKPEDNYMKNESNY